MIATTHSCCACATNTGELRTTNRLISHLDTRALLAARSNTGEMTRRTAGEPARAPNGLAARELVEPLYDGVGNSLELQCSSYSSPDTS